MQRPESENRSDEQTSHEEGILIGDQSDESSVDSDEWDDEPSFDWVVFLLRASALVTIGAMLMTSVDLSRNQGADWVTVMRLAILPFVGAMLLLAGAELIDRKGD